MSPLSLLLVVVAAFTHATWNLLAKKAANVGAPFIAAYTAAAAIIYAPIAAWALLRFGRRLSGSTLFCIGASAALHLGYSLVLQRGYRVADLSVVYPIARGTGPLLSSVGAFLLLREQVTWAALLGLVAVVSGILLLASGGRLNMLADRDARPGVAWGGATGASIAAYTVTDGWGIKVLGINPVLLDWFANIVRVIFLLPTILRDWAGVRNRMEGCWILAAAVGALAPLGYILVLTALRLGAPARRSASRRRPRARDVNDDWRVARHGRPWRTRDADPARRLRDDRRRRSSPRKLGWADGRGGRF